MRGEKTENGQFWKGRVRKRTILNKTNVKKAILERKNLKKDRSTSRTWRSTIRTWRYKSDLTGNKSDLTVNKSNLAVNKSDMAVNTVQMRSGWGRAILVYTWLCSVANNTTAPLPTNTQSNPVRTPFHISRNICLFMFPLLPIRRMLHDVIVSPPVKTSNNYRR